MIGGYDDFAGEGQYRDLVNYLQHQGKEVKPHRFASYAEYTSDLVYTKHQIRDGQDAYDRKVKLEWYGPPADEILSS